MDKQIIRLKAALERFIKHAEEICGPDAPYYEPPTQYSHIWAELVSSVEHAKDTLVEIE